MDIYILFFKQFNFDIQNDEFRDNENVNVYIITYKMNLNLSSALIKIRAKKMDTRNLDVSAVFYSFIAPIIIPFI